jgi:hypothetical protein
MTYLQNGILATVHLIPDYAQMEGGAAQNSILYTILWILGDMTEANFYKSYIAGIGLLLGSLVAHYLYKKNSKYQGFSIAYGSGLWPWVLTASTVSLVAANLIYGWNLADSGWFPTFVVFVSVPAATILVYGGGWKNVLMGALAADIIVIPLSRLFMVYICGPTGIPGVAGSVFGMWAGGVVCFEIFHLLPWMKLPAAPAPAEAAGESEALEPPAPILEDKHIHPSRFFVRRVFADFSEPVFAGNEITSAGLLIGLFISWILCPGLPVYQSGTLPTLLMAEILTGTLSVFIYWDHWMDRPWFPSFPSMVSVAPSVAWVFGGSVPAAVLAAVFGAFICPAMADFIIRKLPKDWPLVIGTTFSMTVGTCIVGMFIICIRGIIPGL